MSQIFWSRDNSNGAFKFFQLSFGMHPTQIMGKNETRSLKKKMTERLAVGLSSVT